MPMLEWLRAGADAKASGSVRGRAQLGPDFAFHSERGQYHSSELLAKLQQHSPSGKPGACSASPPSISTSRF